jgi:hypothetical protein
MAIWYIFGNMVYCLPFWYFGPRKIWQPWSESSELKTLNIPGANAMLKFFHSKQIHHNIVLKKRAIFFNKNSPKNSLKMYLSIDHRKTI